MPERLPLKIETFQRIEPHLADDAIVATSASGLLIKDMQDGWQDPSRFLLGHPFNPPHLIPLVELLGNEKQIPTPSTGRRRSKSCGKVTIRVMKEVPAHVANRLQAALWREAIHLVAEGVASVEDVDKAVTAGPGLRWSVMGPHMLFGLGSGGGGIEEFCNRYGDSFHRWWDSLGSPRLDADVIARLAEGLEEEEAGRSFEDLSALRDQRLIAALRAFAKTGWDMSEPPIAYIDRTRAYYLALGYDNPYRWARFEDVPFTPLTKPLAEMKLAIITTAALFQPDKEIRAPVRPIMLVPSSIRSMKLLLILCLICGSHTLPMIAITPLQKIWRLTFLLRRLLMLLPGDVSARFVKFFSGCRQTDRKAQPWTSIVPICSPV